MIRFNGVEYDYRPGLSLDDMIREHNLTRAKVDLKSCVVIINGAAVQPDQTQGRALSDNDTVFVVPKLDGG